MKQEISFRFLYNVTNQVFNVGSEGTKTYYDPRGKMCIPYASAQNVKHNIRSNFFDIMYEKCGVQDVQTYFRKTVKDKKVNQGSALISWKDFFNPATALFGAWNAFTKDEGNDKYSKFAFQSLAWIGELRAISPDFVAVRKNDIIRANSPRDKVQFKMDKDKKGQFLDMDEFFEKYPKLDDEVKHSIEVETGHAESYVNTNCTATGLYYLPITINLKDFGKMDVTGIKLSNTSHLDPTTKTVQETIKDLLNNGYILSQDPATEKIYLMPESPEFAIEMWKAFVEALMTWRFTSNTALHGHPIELLRVAAGVNKAAQVEMSCNVAYRSDASKRTDPNNIRFYDEGLMVWNSPLLERYYDCEANSVKVELSNERFINEILTEGIKIIEESFKESCQNRIELN